MVEVSSTVWPDEALSVPGSVDEELTKPAIARAVVDGRPTSLEHGELRFDKGALLYPRPADCCNLVRRMRR